MLSKPADIQAGMKLLIPIILISLMGFIMVDCSRRQRSPTSLIEAENAIKKIQFERKERRILRKKKQRLKELRAEIRMLTQQFRNGASVSDLRTQMKKEHKLKEMKKSREDRWRRKLLEKMKNILRRLDRIENKTRVKKGDILHSVVTQPSPVESTTTILKTSIHPPTDVQSKMQRIKSSIDQSQKGGNGTLCLTHKDCRPGHCCQKTTIDGIVKSICSFFSLSESRVCIDSCQCTQQLHCFQPTTNETKPFCKRAESDDVVTGIYLYNKDAVFSERRSKRKS